MQKKIVWIMTLIPLLLIAQPAHRIVLEVLGSGGPEMGDRRASSAYLIWIDDKSRILVDFGGGASLRFEESGAKIEDLEVILLTHLHIDHTADLPALLKAAFFTDAKGVLPLYGPQGNRRMPDTATFVSRLFADGKGAWQYMGDHLDGRADLQLRAQIVKETRTPIRIFKKGDLSIEAVSVHHGVIPALAYRVNIGNRSITFSGDMNGAYHTLEKLANRTDMLVAHNAVPKGASSVAAQLHMTPDTIGRIARQTNPHTLILSHRMLRTLGKEHESLLEIRKHYQGKVTFADDGDRFPLR